MAASKVSDRASFPPAMDRAGRFRRGKSPKATDQTIYASIYHAVLSQRLSPGSRLPEVALGEIFGVSRSIVRKALTRLASDHVIEQHPNQVARVVKPSVDETRQIFEARRAVEAEVVRLTAGTLKAPKVRELKKLLEKENSAHERGKDRERVQQSMAIHQFMASNCPNQILAQILTDLVLQTSIVIALYKAPGIAACYLGDDHAHLAELVIKGEGDMAATLVRDHLFRLEAVLDLNDHSETADLMQILSL